MLACADGMDNKIVATRQRVTPQTVSKWRACFVKLRLDGLLDAPRVGAPRSIDDARVDAVVAKTLEALPQGDPLGLFGSPELLVPAGFTAIGYGGVGAARAIEHLRLIGIELDMAPTHNAVHLGGGDLLAVRPMGKSFGAGDKSIEDIEAHLLPSAKAALDDLAWWAKATMAARITG